MPETTPVSASPRLIPLPKSESERARVLVFCLDNWSGMDKLPRGLNEAGCSVFAMYPRGNVLAYTRALMDREEFLLDRYVPGRLRARLAAAVQRWKPHAIVPVDEAAMRFCRDVLRAAPRTEAETQLQVLLERSLGRTDTLDQRFSRLEAHNAARAAGVRVPRQMKVSAAEDATRFGSEVGYPVVLKRENTSSGTGVSICANEQDLLSALDELRVRTHRRLRFLNTLRPAQLRRSKMADAGFTLQEYVAGPSAMCAVLSVNGEVLGSVPMLRERTHVAPTGQSTVVRLLDKPEMKEAAARLVEAFGTTGFSSLDFIVSLETGAAYFLEYNPRPTPVMHLGTRFGVDLCGRYRAFLEGREQPSDPPPTHTSITLFPREWYRDSGSELIHGNFHDVPWDDPEVVAFYCQRYVKGLRY